MLQNILLGALRKKSLLALAVGGVVFSSAYAFAATLGVSSNSLGAGNAAVSACASTITAQYSVAYDTTIPGYRVSGINLNNLAACAGKTVTAVLTGAANASLGQVTYTVLTADATAGNKTIPVAGSVNAGTVTGVSVALAG
jgi:hypothetical protein